MADRDPNADSPAPDPAKRSDSGSQPAAPAAGLFEPLPMRVQRRNFTFGVMNGVFFTLVSAFVSPTLVLALFVTKLGGSNILVGLLPAIATGCYLLPQLFVAARLQAMPKVMGWYTWPGVVRCIAYALLTLAVWLLGSNSGNYGLLLGLFFVLYLIYSLTAGLSGVPWVVVVGKVVPPRRRGIFFGLRNFGGSILALFASGLIKVLLDEQNGIGFPLNFVIIFAITTLLVSLGIATWAVVKEPAQRTVQRAMGIMEMIRRGPQNLRADRSYRFFLFARIMLTLAAIADPFYIVYAVRQIGAPDSVAALYAAALTIASIAGNLIWSPLADYAGNRRMMFLTAITALAVPTAALLIPLLANAGWLGWVANIPGVGGFAGKSGGVVSVPFALVFIFSGLAVSAANVINTNVLLNIAPPPRRSEYIGYLNTVLGLVTFIPVVGGLLIDWFGFVPVFIVAATMGLGGVICALGIGSERYEALLTKQLTKPYNFCPHHWVQWYQRGGASIAARAPSTFSAPPRLNITAIVVGLREEDAMIIPETHADLLTTTALAHIATIGPHGEPQVNPVWFDWDGEHIRISLTRHRQKLRNLERDPHIALSIVDPINQFRYLEVRGVVERVEDDGDHAFLNALAQRYIGRSYPWPRPNDERVIIYIRPLHTTSMNAGRRHQHQTR